MIDCKKHTIQENTKEIVLQFLKDEKYFITIPDLAYNILSSQNINNAKSRERIYPRLAVALRQLVNEKKVREYPIRVAPRHSSLGQFRYKAYKLT